MWRRRATDSRGCVVCWGNPLAFAVVELLAENRELSVSEIVRAVGRSVQRVSTVLGVLRVAEVVRYQPTESTIATGSSTRAR